jgi:hypothetical protein
VFVIDIHEGGGEGLYPCFALISAHLYVVITSWLECLIDTHMNVDSWL